MRQPVELIGKTLLIAGGVMILLGLLFIGFGNLPGLGRLPGDRVFHVGNATIHFPIVTMLLVSVVLTIILNLIIRLFRA